MFSFWKIKLSFKSIHLLFFSTLIECWEKDVKGVDFADILFLQMWIDENMDLFSFSSHRFYTDHKRFRSFEIWNMIDKLLKTWDTLKISYTPTIQHFKKERTIFIWGKYCNYRFAGFNRIFLFLQKFINSSIQWYWKCTESCIGTRKFLFRTKNIIDVSIMLCPKSIVV